MTKRAGAFSADELRTALKVLRAVAMQRGAEEAPRGDHAERWYLVASLYKQIGRARRRATRARRGLDRRQGEGLLVAPPVSPEAVALSPESEAVFLYLTPLIGG